MPMDYTYITCRMWRDRFRVLFITAMAEHVLKKQYAVQFQSLRRANNALEWGNLRRLEILCFAQLKHSSGSAYLSNRMLGNNVKAFHQKLVLVFGYLQCSIRGSWPRKAPCTKALIKQQESIALP